MIKKSFGSIAIISSSLQISGNISEVVQYNTDKKSYTIC